jgi:hypothetical protein
LDKFIHKLFIFQFILETLYTKHLEIFIDTANMVCDRSVLVQDVGRNHVCVVISETDKEHVDITPHIVSDQVPFNPLDHVYHF